MQKEIYLKLTVKPQPPLTKFQKFTRFFGFIIVLFAFGLAIPHETTLSSQKIEDNVKIIESKNPTKIKIEKLNLDLPIHETSIIDETWEISSKGASHLDKSQDPGQTGNMIIYDHNTFGHFANLYLLKINDQIQITNEDGRIYTYRVYQTSIAEPNQIDILYTYKNETLSLYTCHGFLDSKRFVVKAERIL